jgi:hypothetical protein
VLLAKKKHLIRTLESRVRELELDRAALEGGPSFGARIQTERLKAQRGRPEDMPSTSIISEGKFANYELVRSHGFDVPQQFGRWERPEDIPWDDLPDRVVVKPARGSTARGVAPLIRVPGGWRVATYKDVVSTEQVVERLAELLDEERIAGPFGAEELLDGSNGPNTLPIDVKAYTFYGEVPLLLLCKRRRHGRPSRSQFRYIDPTGQDLAGIAERSPTAHTIDPPANLDRVIEVASGLSLMFRAPFARIDLFAVGDRVVFGEVTPRPGGTEWFGPELDATLGATWDAAESRLWADVAAGMPRMPEPGRA